MSNTWARVQNNAAVEVVTTNPAAIFHPEVAVLFTSVPDGTLQGASWNGSSWTNPPAPTPLPAPPPAPVIVGPGVFYTLFTPAERRAIKASTDPAIQEFWATFQIALQSNTPINLSSLRAFAKIGESRWCSLR